MTNYKTHIKHIDMTVTWADGQPHLLAFLDKADPSSATELGSEDGVTDKTVQAEAKDTAATICITAGAHVDAVTVHNKTKTELWPDGTKTFKLDQEKPANIRSFTVTATTKEAPGPKPYANGWTVCDTETDGEWTWTLDPYLRLKRILRSTKETPA